MDVNRSYKHNGFVPVIHVSRHLDEYLDQLTSDEQLEGKRAVALGGIVPNLLRARKAMSYDVVLSSLGRTRSELRDKSLHVFGVGGTATLHLAALLGIDSVDSSGWRNRAARGIIQLPGRGDRMVANMGSWRGRAPSDDEWHTLSTCHCPACDRFGLRGLSASGLVGFCHRATHNLWTLLQEAQSIEFHLSSGDYESWYMSHVDNSIYRPLIECVLKNQQLARNASQNATSISGLEKTL
jgi:tRNA-guanine family transglycosylase